ncbi:unnamed protein product [Durusdinium trenchii]|uniref:cGMP-dependent protein kinase n=1 Tax=Durusdinium trenchii TaxID=1381693 RepID=A0ABP0HZJ2_9DINO
MLRCCKRRKTARGSTAEGTKIESLAQEKKRMIEKNIALQEDVIFISQVNLFKRVPKEMHPLLVTSLTSTQFKSGQSVVKQGDQGTELFIIRSGEVTVLVSKDGKAPKRVASLKAGDYFGERAVMFDEPRGATVVAATAATAFSMTKEKFTELNLEDYVKFAQRRTSGPAAIEAKLPSEKTEADRQMLMEALRKNPNLRQRSEIVEMHGEALIDLMWKQSVEARQVMISQGNMADYFYIIQDGKFAVQSDSITKAALKPGDCFGELPLLQLRPHEHSVLALERSNVWVIDRWQFKNILFKVPEHKLMEYIAYLDRVSLLDALSLEEKTSTAQALTHMHFKMGDVIIQQGETGDSFYILFDGEVQVVINGNTVATLQASIQELTAHHFGEKALMSSQPRAATIRVSSTEAQVLALDRIAFNTLLGSLEEIIRAQEDGKSRQTKAVKGIAIKPFQKIFRKDLVGVGAFGAVELVAHRHGEETFAMKSMSKGLLLKAGQRTIAFNEKLILQYLLSPFIIQLFEAYRDEQTLYLLFEAVLGGDLHGLYSRKKLYGNDKHAAFYTASVSLALQYLHKRSIVYRDLHPENILVTNDGNIKLCDFALAKFVAQKTYTICGIQDYFAPEMVLATGHGFPLDWWTLGIFLFELMSGKPPFESSNPMEIYVRILKGLRKVPDLPEMGRTPADLIKQILRNDPQERLPVRLGFQKLKEHRFFGGINWRLLVDLRFEAPYLPRIRGKRDLANFCPQAEDLPQAPDYEDDGTAWDKDFPT